MKEKDKTEEKNWGKFVKNTICKEAKYSSGYHCYSCFLKNGLWPFNLVCEYVCGNYGQN